MRRRQSLQTQNRENKRGKSDNEASGSIESTTECTMERDMKSGEKENIVKEEHVFPVRVKKWSKAEKVANARSGMRIVEPESQRPHLTFLL